MKSICIKTNNENIIEYLLIKFQESNINNMFFRKNTFKIYKNIVLHYTGNNLESFYTELSSILTDCILSFYEEKMVEHLINLNYFYFDDFEKKQIYNDCLFTLNSTSSIEFFNRRESIFASIFEYIKDNNSIILSGFVNFRLSNYVKSLDYVVDISVNKYILEKEYREFIDLLKLYINSKECTIDKVHLIYMHDDAILLDNNKNIINLSKNVFNAKYLSDISFSSNDYILNTLLDLIPEEIHLHLINEEDEFTDSLKAIFGNRIHVCTDCDICKTYKLINKELSSIKNNRGLNNISHIF